jgi:hypothetical protein
MSGPHVDLECLIMSKWGQVSVVCGATSCCKFNICSPHCESKSIVFPCIPTSLS